MSKYTNPGNTFFDTEAACTDKSEESSNSSEDEYDYNDGFLVPDHDSEAEEEHTPIAIFGEIQFERKRAEMALDEVYKLRKLLKTCKRKLKTMSKKKKTWERRAKRSKLRGAGVV